MFLARRVLTGLAAASLLAACSAPRTGPVSDSGSPQRLNGAALTFTLAGQRFALAALAPPVPMVLLRTGTFVAWATPSLEPHNVYLQDVAMPEGKIVDTFVLPVNPGGRSDYVYSVSWR